METSSFNVDSQSNFDSEDTWSNSYTTVNDDREDLSHDLDSITDVITLDQDISKDEKFEILSKRLDEVIDTNTRLQNEMLELKKDLWDAWDSIYYIEKDVSAFQQHSRRENIELCGIPESYDDNLENNVNRNLSPNRPSYTLVV